MPDDQDMQGSGGRSDDEEPGQKPKGFLARLGAKVTEMGFSRDALMVKVRIGDIAAVRVMLNDARAISIGGANLVDGWGLRAMHYASAEGQLEMARYLVCEMGAYPNSLTETDPDSDNFQICERRTPLHFAAINGHHSIVAFLTERLVNPVLKDLYGKDPRFYAKDNDMKRAIKLAEDRYKNFHGASDTLEEMMIFKNGFIRPPADQEVGRVLLTYKEMAKDVTKYNKHTGNSVPVPNMPGKSTIRRMVVAMNRKGEEPEIGCLGIMNESVDTLNPIPIYVKFQILKYHDESTVVIQDLYASPSFRRVKNASTLILHTLLYAARGRHLVKRALALVPSGNMWGISFFDKIGFTIEPPYRVPKRFRKPDHVTFVASEISSLCAKIGRQLKGFLVAQGEAKQQEFKSRGQRTAEEEEKFAKKLAKDYDIAQKKIELLYNPPLEREKTLPVAIQGGPLIDISNQPRRPGSAKRNRFALKEKDPALSAKEEEQDEERFVCEIDRITHELSEAFRPSIVRSRNYSEWLNRLQNRRRGNSRVLNQPETDFAIWMEHLDCLAQHELPAGWITQHDDSGKLSYFNFDTQESRATRPISAAAAAQKDFDKVRKEQKTAMNPTASRPRSATPGVRLILDDFSNDGAGSDAAVKKYPFLELTALKQEEEAERKRELAEERIKFDKRCNFLINACIKNNYDLPKFKKVAAKEWGDGSPDYEVAIEKARLVLPAALVSSNPTAESNKSKKAATDHQSSVGKTATQLDAKVDYQCKHSQPVEGVSTPATKSIRFGMDETRTIETIRGNSVAISAKDFGASLPQTRRQLLRSPQRGRPEPFTRPSSAMVSSRPSSSMISNPYVAPDSVQSSRNLPRSPKKGCHTKVSIPARDAAAEWVETEAEKEQALHDADNLLELFAPPKRMRLADEILPEDYHNFTENDIVHGVLLPPFAPVANPAPLTMDSNSSNGLTRPATAGTSSIAAARPITSVSSRPSTANAFGSIYLQQARGIISSGSDTRPPSAASNLSTADTLNGMRRHLTFSKASNCDSDSRPTSSAGSQTSSLQSRPASGSQPTLSRPASGTWSSRPGSASHVWFARTTHAVTGFESRPMTADGEVNEDELLVEKDGVMFEYDRLPVAKMPLEVRARPASALPPLFEK